ncbi:colicin V production protein [Altererythrobacter sp. B11]|uniref:CvpA family protein n=1 Tax=Altererythrobacter sp. B11 TaxID=2060312 RepID=UPI000DC6FE89|nr:CvpA family protein [Altererythrobacter sp. B11]BBC73112.1 colicin V production protein [Altererythrobacter sp. B11]
MAGFDIIVLLIVGAAAVGGFLRGFVQEVLSLAAWAVAVIAIYFLHTDLTSILFGYTDSPTGAAVAAFGILLILPYGIMKIIARTAGKASRNSVLGPVDRVLGFGFGVVKGVLIVILAFSALVLVYDTIWGPSGRPDWIKTARSYSFINASSDELVQLIGERNRRLREEDAQVDSGG